MGFSGLTLVGILLESPMFCWAYSVSITVITDGVPIARPIKAKCPRTQGAAYYNFTLIIMVLFKNATRHSVQKILQTAPRGLH